MVTLQNKLRFGGKKSKFVAKCGLVSEYILCGSYNELLLMFDM